MIHKPVRKAVIAAAGFGTRFLPQTKALPKEMLPLVDKPIIQYIVEELVAAGIQDIVIVTGHHKRSIEDHFDYMSADLRVNLRQGGKLELLEETKKISDLANFVYVRQKGPYGNATPIMNAEHLLGDEPFIYTYADDFIDAEPSRFKQMIETFERTGNSVIPCIQLTTNAQYTQYGVVAGNELTPDVLEMTTIVEKPGKADAPSDLANVGGYLLTPDIFKYLHESLETLEDDKEFQIQPAMRALIEDGGTILAFKLQNARYYDTGNKLEYLKTVVDLALKRDDLKDDFRAYLQKIVASSDNTKD